MSPRHHLRAPLYRAALGSAEEVFDYVYKCIMENSRCYNEAMVAVDKTTFACMKCDQIYPYEQKTRGKYVCIYCAGDDEESTEELDDIASG